MSRIRIVPVAVAVLALGWVTRSAACPFCSVESLTLTEEMDSANAVVVARLVKEALPPDTKPDGLGGFGVADPETGKATFEIVEILKGKESLVGIKEVKAIFYEAPSRDKLYLIRGVGEPPEWTIPFALSDTAVGYVKQLPTLPKEGPERIKFFLKYLEHEDSLLAQDSYDEFARAPYEDVKAIKEQMDREQLLAWIESPHVSPSRRRLFLTLLGVCGQPEDLARLEQMILSDAKVLAPAAEAISSVSVGSSGPIATMLLPEMVRAEERRRKLGLDALIGCYVVLGGPERMDVVDRRFLQGTQEEISHTYTVLMALRILTDGMEVLPPERAAASARLLLDNRDFADQVIPDLARWGDWSVVDRLADMFRKAEKQSYVREPVVTYMDIAAEQPGDIGEKARVAIAEFETMDPDSVERARSLAAFGMLARARGDDPSEAPPSATRETAEAAEAAAADTGESATAGDLVAEETPVSEIPDPAAGLPTTYNETEAAEVATVDAEATSEPEVVEVQPAANGEAEPSSEPVQVSVSKPAVEPLAEPSRGWIIGLPLLGGVLFMGLFWIILRAGPG